MLGRAESRLWVAGFGLVVSGSSASRLSLDASGDVSSRAGHIVAPRKIIASFACGVGHRISPSPRGVATRRFPRSGYGSLQSQITRAAGVGRTDDRRGVRRVHSA
jgi:hypothetical protein